MFASSRQRSTPSGSLTGEEVKNTQQGGDLEASETEVNRYTPPAQEGHQTPGHSTHARLRSRTSSDTTIPPPPAPRMFSHGVCAPTSDAGLSHAVTYNDHHDTGSGSHPETAKASAFTASPLVSERQRFLCCSSISPGSRSARGSTRGSACFRSAFQLAKWISLAVVLGALFVDVYLLKEAIFMEDSGVDIAPTSESAGPSQVGAVHRQRSPRPRLPLPLVVAHHVFTNRGLPAEENTYTADRAAVVRQSGYTVDTDNNVGDNPINNNAGDTEPPSSPLSQQAARVPSSEKHSATTKLRMGEPRMNTKQNIVDDYWQEQDTNQAVNNKQNWRDQRQEPGQPDMIMANDKTAIFAGHEQPTLAPETVSEMYGGQRVAVVVPYIGNDLPVWWDVFAEQARHNEGLVDWIIFCDQVPLAVAMAINPPVARMAWVTAIGVEVTHFCCVLNHI